MTQCGFVLLLRYQGKLKANGLRLDLGRELFAYSVYVKHYSSPNS